MKEDVSNFKINKEFQIKNRWLVLHTHRKMQKMYCNTLQIQLYNYCLNFVIASEVLIFQGTKNTIIFLKSSQNFSFLAVLYQHRH